jgi:hypothetical protein
LRLGLQRQRHLGFDDEDEGWYLQDRDGLEGNEETNLFGTANHEGIDWDQLPEEDPLDPSGGLSAEELLELWFQRAATQISKYQFYLESVAKNSTPRFNVTF